MDTRYNFLWTVVEDDPLGNALTDALCKLFPDVDIVEVLTDLASYLAEYNYSDSYKMIRYDHRDKYPDVNFWRFVYNNRKLCRKWCELTAA